MRRDLLCDGGERGELDCPASPERVTPDGRAIERERCAHCPLNELDFSLSMSAIGQAIQVAMSINEQLEYGCKVTADDILATDWRLLRRFRIERGRRQDELERQAAERR